MKDRLIGFIKTYCLFVCIFVLQKPLFMLFYESLYPDASCADWFSVIWHGLPLDLSLAGYLTAIPGFLFITSVWTLSKSLHRIWCGYFLFISVLLSIIFTVDLGLYEYWGFRLDATPLFYFFSSPKSTIIHYQCVSTGCCVHVARIKISIDNQHVTKPMQRYDILPEQPKEKT